MSALPPKADIADAMRNVRFAKSRHYAAQQNSGYSITSSAREQCRRFTLITSLYSFGGLYPPVDHSRRTATIAHRRMGTARKAPTGPHIQLQNAMERKTRNGLIVRR